MADFYTTDLEENLIDRVRKEGFGYRGDELPKYFILRIALARALHCDKIPLDSPKWEDKKLSGKKSKEYHLEQITGKGKEKREDYDLLLRALLYMQHKEELEREQSNIFSDEKIYLDILDKYIKRGLYEIQYSWKSRDCFYQWCLDNLGLESSHSTTPEIPQSSDMYFTKIQSYFKRSAINIEIRNTKNSYRHHICDIVLEDSSKIQSFHTQAKFLYNELGTQDIIIQQLEGVPRGFRISIPKPQNQWQALGKKEYQQGLRDLQAQGYVLGIFAGYTLDNEPLHFDLSKAPHIFIAGTTGSGKTSFLCVMITTLLLTQKKENLEIIIIDPKKGVDYNVFKDKVELITDINNTYKTLDSLIEKMESRYENMNNVTNFPYIICFIDELNDLAIQDKTINEKLARLALKSRQAKIHLVLGTQRPDSKTFSGNLRSNIPSQIALKVRKATESKIILDEIGAEKLLGSGDMLLKMPDYSQPKRALGINLKENEIKELLSI